MSNKPSAASKNFGSLFIVAAPSGAGKSSLVNALLENNPNLELSISTTTRPPRPGESEGSHYHFVDLETFETMRAAGEFLESARVFDNWYGTSSQAIAQILERGHDVILEIDWQGARQVVEQFPDVYLIFILPPSIKALRQRLSKRAQDSEAVIEQRMREARREMAHWVEFDYLVINDIFEHALDDLHSIVRCAHLRQADQRIRHRKLLEELFKTD